MKIFRDSENLMMSYSFNKYKTQKSIKQTLYRVIIFLILSLILLNCNNLTEPNQSDSLRLTLSADRISGNVPLTIKFSGKIEGNTEGLIGHVPDYFFFSQIGKTLIPYSLPDTSQALKQSWNSEETYQIAGEYKVVLLYQGIQNGNHINLYSDTLVIKAN